VTDDPTVVNPRGKIRIPLMELDLGPVYSEKAVAKGIDVRHGGFDGCLGALKNQSPTANSDLPGNCAARCRFLCAPMKRRVSCMNWGDDGSGLWHEIHSGVVPGYYIDVGAIRPYLRWQDKAQDPVSVKEIKEHSVVFIDGSELPADLIRAMQRATAR
jgi:putative flavoprotein involved in K+ transport